MRLLNIKTRRLEEFFGDTTPPYAILSHTWGRDEVTFQDLSREEHKLRHGYKKIEGCCQAAAEQRLSYVWVDTCCIDKSSSAELSEAINSMFKWYETSTVCFIYMEDLPTGTDPFSLTSAFRQSRWWTRGWTLQELLAPRHIIFFDSIWNRQIRYELITEITGIPSAVLVKELPLSQVSAACKFAWASQRVTTRVEDKSYCLMGLMGVNMPLLYGEGDKAFVRLQEAVISSSDDISLLAW
ncbi:heterokaryon incompatibility protein-domain-containing protein, partial [Massariosphaeria phaeospora]